MHTFRIGQAAELLGVSADTVRRWADGGRLRTTRTDGGHRVVDGRDLAELAMSLNDATSEGGGLRSARNNFTGIVTRVTRDLVMAQVELQCGPFRIVSLLSREAADELQLEPGVLAVASVKATNVVIELPAPA